MAKFQRLIKKKSVLTKIPYSSFAKAQGLSKMVDITKVKSHGIISQTTPRIISAQVVGKRKKRLGILGYWEFEI